ncbi:GDA1/CD39 (nucleoside phosphatase) family [Musa troglodytarum]|uniref:GDA1/CD39 (Nucleoside phosphatase) family n=1 Tax=Musa troglodytarum TaxID=320322 RepID=A0A9E7HMX1_9LILI|nr:GDA1/CD39 (nucleoside phosphatase) family [Musa troglodytarum]
MRRSNARPPAVEPEPSHTMSASKHHQLRPSSVSSRVSFLSPSNSKHHRRVDGGGRRCAVIALAAAFLCLFIVTRGPDSRKYAIILDGGSTGTRIHVFAYRIGWGSMPTLDLGLTASMKVSPGLSSYAADPENAGQSLVELLEFAKERVPGELWEDTEVRLMATAGLRLLDEAVVERILESCRKVLWSSGFQFQHDWAAVISGRAEDLCASSDEGIYAWVAANYALGSLGGEPKKTTGIFELGGASIQATFVSSEPLAPVLSHVLQFGKITYNLYSDSFLYLGQNVAYDSLHNLLSSGDLRSSGAFIQEETYIDPCIPRGYMRGGEPGKLSTSLLNSKTTYRSSRAIGNFSECRLAALKLLEKEKEKCLSQVCHFRLTSMPKLQGRFLATENFFHTSKFLGLGPTPLLSELIMAGEQFCGEDWLRLKRKYDTYDEEDLLRFCFSTAYIVALLHDTLGFAMDDGRVAFANQVGNIPLDWALGAFITQKTSRPSAEISDWIFAVLGDEASAFLYLFVSIMLIFTALSVLKWMKPKLKIIYDLERGRYILTPVNR